MAVGANTEIDFYTRIANLENALFGGPNPTGAALPFPGTSQPPVVTLSGTTDAIVVKTGTVMVLNASAADLMTLANPTSGGPGIGDDGKTLTIISNTAFAHTITTGAHGINGNKNIATFGAAIGNLIELKAYNGAWYMVLQIGITLSGA